MNIPRDTGAQRPPFPDRPSWARAETGEVNFVCPREGCTFHEWIVLLDWSAP